MKKLRILTTVHLANPGACLFTETLTNILQESLSGSDVRVLNYLPRNWYFYELARALKPNFKQPLLNIQRYLISEQFHRKQLTLEKSILTMPYGYKRMISFLNKQSYDALVVGMVIWDIVKKTFIPQFPNIYWLSNEITAKKIAYAVSGHRTNINLFKRNLPEIQKTLNSYSLIGVRDSITYNMVQDAKLERHIPIVRVPDPVFLYRIDEESARTIEKLEKHGVDMAKPIIGFIFHGNSHLAERLADVYHSQGYQIISISMYNPFADVNLAHLLSPHEWANTFPLMSFCVTDRFHGTIMCLKSKIPFIAIEPYKPVTQDNSKIFSLLNDFELLDCYVNEYDDGFNVDLLLERILFLKSNWESKYRHAVEKKLIETKNMHYEFLSKIRVSLSS